MAAIDQGHQVPQPVISLENKEIFVNTNTAAVPEYLFENSVAEVPGDATATPPVAAIPEGVIEGFEVPRDDRVTHNRTIRGVYADMRVAMGTSTDPADRTIFQHL